jgi:hypothetical protein
MAWKGCGSSQRSSLQVSLVKHSKMDVWHTQIMLNLETGNGGYCTDNIYFIFITNHAINLKELKPMI